MIALTTDHLARWTSGNAGAICLIVDLWLIAELWDDLIDKDTEATPARIDAAFHKALIDIPRNSFYQRYFQDLNPLMEAAILDWQTGTALESSTSVDDLHQAYVLRCSLTKIVVACARIIGGIDHARAVSLEVSRMGDTWTDYAAGHGVT